VGARSVVQGKELALEGAGEKAALLGGGGTGEAVERPWPRS
jgi:hypothetical protein